MSFASSPLRWRRPDRKSSTPSFPGAWPDGSTHDMTIIPDTPARPLVQSRFDRQPLSNLDYVTDFHRRLSESLNSRPTVTPPALVTPSMSASSYVSSFAEGTSNSASSTLNTPETLSPVESLSPVSKPCPSSWRSLLHQPRARSYHHVDPLFEEDSYLDRDLHVGANPGSAAISPPMRLPRSVPAESPALSPDSMASYFSTSEQFSRIGSQEIVQQHFSSASTSSNLVSPELPPIPLSTDFAQSFFPIFDDDYQGTHESTASRPSVPRSNADSPVLPSDEGHGSLGLGLSPNSRSSRTRRTAQELAPSAADMDAFAMSAHIPDTDSARSIPTSFVSDFAMGSFNHDFSLAARGLGHRQQSSPSLDASAETLDLEDGHECIYQQRRDVEVRQPKKDRYVPSPSSSRPRHAKRVSTVIAGALPMDDQALKASPFAKFKAFGAKIKKAFGKKTRQPSSGIGVTTTTAVTAIEYKSEHPIPAPKSKPSSKEKMPRNQRRKSMPVHLLESRVSRPQPLRPTSFLAMDPGPSFRQLLPGNDSSQPSSAPWISRRPRSRSSGLNMPPSPGAKVSDTVPSLAPPESPQRIRSKSSPAMTGPSGSRLDLLRSTILPHPPIPNKPLVGNEYPRRLQAGHGRTEYAASLSRERGRIVGSSVSLSSEEGRDGHQRQATTSATSREATLDGYELIDCSTSDFVHTSPSSMRRRSATSNFRPSKDSKDTSDRKNSHSRSPSKRRYRGFSFTKRASKTVSSPAPPVPDLPKNLRGAHTRPGMALNTLLKGLSPQKKAEYLRQWQQQQRVGTPGCADYDPDLVLDTMSFAHIPDPTHSATTTTTNADLLISPDSIDVPIHAIHMDNLDGDVARDSPASGAPMDDTMEVELADREEERGYLRALGLEFDVVGAAEAF